MPRVRTQPGFTLVELMIVVTITGVLAAVSIASFTRYLWRARTAEALLNLGDVARSAKVYWMTDRGRADGRSLGRQFPATTDFPGYCCTLGDGRCAGGRNVAVGFASVPTWLDLRFSVDDPHLFSYSFQGLDRRAVISAEAYLGACWVPAGFRYFSLSLDGSDDGVSTGTVREGP